LTFFNFNTSHPARSLITGSAASIAAAVVLILITGDIRADVSPAFKCQHLSSIAMRQTALRF
jgi:hypothetical protein